jgi:hypothetical protein
MEKGNQMIKEKEYTFGTCEYERISPHKDKLSADTRVLNVILPFEEALKLNLAIDERAQPKVNELP